MTYAAELIYPRNKGWHDLITLFPDYVGARQIFELDLNLVQSSCGLAVPYYELKGERPSLTKWAENRGRVGIEAYWRKKNGRSLNDKETGILKDA